MREFQYDLKLSVIAFIILFLVWMHHRSQGKLEDRNSRIFRKLVLLSMADVFLDFLSTFVPAIGALHMPALYMVLNALYDQTNVYMCYIILHYTDSMRETQQNTAESGVYQRWTAIPGLLSLLLLLINFPTHCVFYYDEMGQHYSGPFGQFVYAIAVFYLIVAVYDILRHKYEYAGKRRYFFYMTFLMLAVSMLVQFMFPDILAIDMGIGLSILSFYLHNSNPVQYIDTMTGALDKSYFDTWVRDQIRLEKRIYLIAVDVKNLQYIDAAQGENYSNHIIAGLAQKLRNLDHEKSIFRLSSGLLMLHCHDEKRYHEELDILYTMLRPGEKQIPEARGCSVRLLGIPHAENLIPQYSINAYVDYLSKKMDSSADDILTESSEETIAGFRYEAEIERFLSEAIEKDLFELAYQPIYSLKERRFVSAEALSRLKHPAFGPLNPQMMINIAENSGLINTVTRLQFRRLCRYMKENPDVTEKLERFKFNLSPLNLLDHLFIAELIGIIEKEGLPYSKFEFEFTESFATQQNEELKEIISLCTERGITLSLDDFGSGYSNLSNVIRIPFANVKLDRSLLTEISSSTRAASFYEGIVHVMQNYRMEIICEGVETEQEKNLLASWSAEMIQGYYYSKPLDGAALKLFLSKV